MCCRKVVESTRRVFFCPIFSNREKITFSLLKSVPHRYFGALYRYSSALHRYLLCPYRGALHRYIQNEMEFLDISFLGTAYRYAVKIKKKLKQKTRLFGPGNPSQKNPGKGNPNPQKKG
jgi:hypothetical protein